jgi:hypothetical protein
MTGVSFALTSFSTQTPGTAARFFADSIFLEFVLGATIFVVVQHIRAGGPILLVLGSAALLAFAETNLPRSAVWGLPAAAILYGIVAVLRESCAIHAFLSQLATPRIHFT